MLLKIIIIEISGHTNHVKVLIVNSSNGKQGILTKGIQCLTGAHFNTKKLLKNIVWVEHFATKYNLKNKSIITDLQTSCRKYFLICLVYCRNRYYNVYFNISICCLRKFKYFLSLKSHDKDVEWTGHIWILDIYCCIENCIGWWKV